MKNMKNETDTLYQLVEKIENDDARAALEEWIFEKYPVLRDEGLLSQNCAMLDIRDLRIRALLIVPAGTEAFMNHKKLTLSVLRAEK